MSASLNWMAWCFESGLPNAWRSFAYEREASRHACASPTDRAAIAIRPPVSVCRNCRYPPPRSPSMLSSGTAQFSKLNGWVSDECQPSFL